jgi:hypothetical protein
MGVVTSRYFTYKVVLSILCKSSIGDDTVRCVIVLRICQLSIRCIALTCQGSFLGPAWFVCKKQSRVEEDMVTV